MERLEASVEGTIYRKEDTGYTVLSVRVGRREMTVVGTMPELSPGDQAVFTGEWVEHPTYGRQLKCATCVPQMPTTRLGIERFLGGGKIRGVGPSTARKIVEQFGEDTLRVIMEDPERLQEVPKMGKKRWMQIAEAVREKAGSWQAMVFLQSYGIASTLADKISKRYGERTETVIRQNPYRLCDDIDGVGFMTADRIGASLGVPADSEGRVAAALKYVLKDAAVGMGHVYLPREELTGRAAQLLRVEADLIEHQLSRMALLRELVFMTSGDEERVYLPALTARRRRSSTALWSCWPPFPTGTPPGRSATSTCSSAATASPSAPGSARPSSPLSNRACWSSPAAPVRARRPSSTASSAC